MKRYIKSAISDVLKEDWQTKQALAKDPKTSPRDLAYLATDTSQYTRQRVAHNPNTPEDVLRRLAQDPYPEVRAYVKLNPSKPKDLQVVMDNKSGTVELEFYIAEPLNSEIKQDLRLISDQVLSKFGCSKLSESYREDPVDNSDFYYLLQYRQRDEENDAHIIGDQIENTLYVYDYYVDGFRIEELLSSGEE